MKAFDFLTSSLCCLLLPTGHLAAQVTFEPLGDLEGGDFSSEALAVSADGSVVVGTGESGTRGQPVVWIDGAVSALDFGPTTFRGRATAVSGDGTIIAGTLRDFGGDPHHSAMFRYPLGSEFEFISGSQITSLSADGSALAGRSSYAGSEPSSGGPFRWKNRFHLYLATEISENPAALLDIRGSTAADISADGSVIVGRIGGDFIMESVAVRWELNGSPLSVYGVEVTQSVLGDLPGRIKSELHPSLWWDLGGSANGVSADGAVIVGRGVSDRGLEAFRWEDDVMVPLGDLPGGDFWSSAFKVSADGNLIVGTGESAAGTEGAFWSAQNNYRPVSLNTFLDQHGIDRNGFQIRSISDVSDDGTTMVGSGTNINGDTEAFRVRVADDNWELPNVPIPDANLEAAIRDELEKPEGDLTMADLEALTSLDAGSANIVDLSGLEFAVNLEWLALINGANPDTANQITDISPLADLTALRELGLGGNPITDLSPLAGLTNLEQLWLWNHPIENVEGLSGLTSLTYLWLEIDPAYPVDLSPLSSLTNLVELSMRRSALTDLGFLAPLTNLQTLNLSHNEITDLSPLADLPNLRNVTASDNRISDLSGILALTHLDFLNVRDNYLNITSGSKDRATLDALQAGDAFPLNLLYDRQNTSAGTWAGYPIQDMADAGRWINTGKWLGWLALLGEADGTTGARWMYSQINDSYFYVAREPAVADPGAWLYALKPAP